jgi:hypothetical protein
MKSGAGEELIRHAAEQLTAERICQLQVAHPRPLSHKEKQRNLTTHAHA